MSTVSKAIMTTILVMISVAISVPIIKEVVDNLPEGSEAASVLIKMLPPIVALATMIVIWKNALGDLPDDPDEIDLDEVDAENVVTHKPAENPQPLAATKFAESKYAANIGSTPKAESGIRKFTGNGPMGAKKLEGTNDTVEVE